MVKVGEQLPFFKQFCGAEFSEDRVYRYLLWRRWNSNKSTIGFIGLNPSTADEMTDDRTVRRCINFAKRWGAGGMMMMNIFGFRATDPKKMIGYQSPVGPKNDEEIIRNAEKCEYIVCAWGNGGDHLGRAPEVLHLLIDQGFESKLRCFSITNKRQPRHPLYVRGDDQISQLPITVSTTKYITNVITFLYDSKFVIYDKRGDWRGNGIVLGDGKLEEFHLYLPRFDENVRIEIAEAIKERVKEFSKNLRGKNGNSKRSKMG